MKLSHNEAIANRDYLTKKLLTNEATTKEVVTAGLLANKIYRIIYDTVNKISYNGNIKINEHGFLSGNNWRNIKVSV